MKLLLVLAAAWAAFAQTGENVLVVVNSNSAISRQVGDYYRTRRSIPVANVCTIATTSDEEIQWGVYEREVETPIAECLKKKQLVEKVLYIVTTMGVPMKVDGPGGGLTRAAASLDSELTLLYSKLKGQKFERPGGIANPFFGKRNAAFRHPLFPIYLVTRLAAYDWNDIKGMIDRSLQARNRGTFVVDLTDNNDKDGNNWLRDAAILLPTDRTLFDDSTRIVTGVKDVIGYASWGSNDPHRKERWLHLQWLPGGIATEFVSTNARTLKRPPDSWTYTDWNDRQHWWGGSPQGLSADFIHEGATGASGNAYEPFLGGCARPDYVLPAYFQGRNLAESFYMGLPLLSWQGVIFGDPLCALK